MKQTLHCVLLWISLCFKLVCSFIEWTNLYDFVRLQFLIVPVYKYCPIFLCKFSNLYFHDYIAKWICSLVINWWTIWSNQTKQGVKCWEKTPNKYMFSTSQDLHKHLLCGKSAFYAKKEPVLYISIPHYTFLYNIKVQYPIVKRGNSNEIYFKFVFIIISIVNIQSMTLKS